MDIRIAKWETKTALVKIGRENLEEQFRKVASETMPMYLQNRVSSDDRKSLAERVHKILNSDIRTLYCEKIFCSKANSYKLHWVTLVSDPQDHQRGSARFSSNECRIVSYTYVFGKKSILRLERPFNYSIDEHVILRFMNRTNQTFGDFVRNLSAILFQSNTISMHYAAKDWADMPLAMPFCSGLLLGHSRIFTTDEYNGRDMVLKADRHSAKQYDISPPTHIYQDRLRLGTRIGLSFTTFVDEGILRDQQTNIALSLSNIIHNSCSSLEKIGRHIILDSEATNTWSTIDMDSIDRVRIAMSEYESVVMSNEYLFAVIIPGHKAIEDRTLNIKS